MGVKFTRCALVSLVVLASGSVASAAKKAKEEDRKSAARFDWAKPGAELDLGTRAQEKRDEAIGKLMRLLPTIPAGEQQADVKFRLAELYWAKAKYAELAAGGLLDKAMEAWHQSGSTGDAPTLASLSLQDSGKIFREDALSIYRGILTDYPRYPRSDEVLYNLGSALYESGDAHQGVSLYWKLLKRYPESNFAPDGWLQLGEHFFDNNKLPEAVQAYSEAAKTNRPRIYAYALYKLAWCDYNLQEYESSLQRFKRVVSYANEQDKEQRVGMEQAGRMQLRGEALRDMVRVYAAIDGLDEPFDYYQAQLGPKDAYRYYLSLAELYQRDGKFPLEIKTRQEMNKRYPYAGSAPLNQASIVEAYAHLGRNAEVRLEAKRLVDLYAPQGVWATRNATNETVLNEAFAMVEMKMAELVTDQHRAAQTTKLATTYKLARDLYADYLKRFPTSDNSYNFRFFYAEILFELKEFSAAAEQYDLVAALGDDKKFAKPASYTSILAWEKVATGAEEEVGSKLDVKTAGRAKGRLKELERIDKLEKGRTYASEPMGEIEQKLANACDIFVRIAKEDPEIVKVKFKSARLYYIHNQFEEAAKRFGELIERWPTDKLARLGAEFIIESFNVRKDWAQLNQWARKFREHKQLMADATFAKRIGEFIEGSSFNIVHDVAEKSDTPLEIAQKYTTFVDQFPESKFRLVALYNSVVYFDKAGKFGNAIENAERSLKAFANYKKPVAVEGEEIEGAKLPEADALREPLLFMTAGFYQRTGGFERAAVLYETYAKDFPQAKQRGDALYNAGLYREGLGQYAQAIANFETYIKDLPNQDDTASVSWRLGEVLARAGRAADATAHFEKLAQALHGKDPGQSVCAAHRGLLLGRDAGVLKDVDTRFQGILTAYNKLDKPAQDKACVRKAGAEALFASIEGEYHHYRSLKLSGAEKEIVRVLKEKTNLIKDIKDRYVKVVAVGDGDMALAGLYRIGVLYQDLATQIMDLQCPDRLSEDQCAIYLTELQSRAFPLEEKAIEAFDRTLAKGFEIGLYNTWLMQSQQALATYEPARFAEVRKFASLPSETVSIVPALIGGGT